jgi:hypothetical protein
MMPAALMLAAAVVLAAAPPAASARDTLGEPVTPAVTESPLRPSIGFLSAASLRDRCESKAAGLVSYCFAYVTGVHDTVQAYETWLRVREFCAPAVSSQSDMRRAFLSYLARNPSAASGEAASVIVLAFKNEFACDTKASAQPVAEAPGKTAPPVPAGK